MSNIIKTKEQQAESIAAVLVLAEQSLTAWALDELNDCLADVCEAHQINYVLVEEYQKLMVNGDNNG